MRFVVRATQRVSGRCLPRFGHFVFPRGAWALFLLAFCRAGRAF